MLNQNSVSLSHAQLAEGDKPPLDSPKNTAAHGCHSLPSTGKSLHGTICTAFRHNGNQPDKFPEYSAYSVPRQTCAWHAEAQQRHNAYRVRHSGYRNYAFLYENKTKGVLQAKIAREANSVALSVSQLAVRGFPKKWPMRWPPQKKISGILRPEKQKKSSRLTFCQYAVLPVCWGKIFPQKECGVTLG